MRYTSIIRKGTPEVLDLLGPTMQFLSWPRDSDAVHCVMLGIIPPGASVPLHSHEDTESFYVLAGSIQVWCEGEHGSAWAEAQAEDFIHVPRSVKHAFRNTAREPVVEVITTTPKLGRFFLEVGRPVIPGSPMPAPTKADLERFLKISSEYGYWNATPDENAAIGINL